MYPQPTHRASDAIADALRDDLDEEAAAEHLGYDDPGSMAAWEVSRGRIEEYLEHEAHEAFEHARADYDAAYEHLLEQSKRLAEAHRHYLAATHPTRKHR